VTDSHWRVPLSDVEVDEELMSVGREALASGWWSMGPRVAALEERFAELTSSTRALAVSNGTAALHLALLAIGCRAGDEVILPSLNFVAAANVVRLVGATPVFCDICGSDDLNMDPADVEAAITPRTKSIIALHYAGYPCDMPAILDIAEQNGTVVVEDAAHAPGARLRAQALGTFGAIGCFSFFANKNLPVGEGGIVVTSSPELGERLALLRSHGMTTLTWQRHTGHASSYDVVEPGLNYRLDELRAAIAIVQLARLEAVNEARRKHTSHYRALLEGIAGITLPFGRVDDDSISSHHLVVALLPDDVDREEVRERMRAAGVQTSVHYPPIHRFSAYADLGARRAIPRTEDLARRIVTLPLYPHMTDDDVELVASSLVDAVRSAPRTSAWPS
jgi:dTDP-4-amino-4,6-dideoxygalactose transaminase